MFVKSCAQILLPFKYSKLLKIISFYFHSSKSIPGTPGTDFPVFNSIPVTRFNCLHANGGSGGPVRPAGFYADIETQCQVRMGSFINNVDKQGEEGVSQMSRDCVQST